MPSTLRRSRDLWAGSIYVLLGAAAVVLGRAYRLGTAHHMGPRYFPMLVGSALLVVGIASIVRAILRRTIPVGSFAWRPLALVTAAVASFGLLLHTAGLAAAVSVLVVASAYASSTFRWRWVIPLAAAVTVFCVLVFVIGLGLPLPILGRWFRH